MLVPGGEMFPRAHRERDQGEFIASLVLPAANPDLINRHGIFLRSRFQVKDRAIDFGAIYGPDNRVIRGLPKELTEIEWMRGIVLQRKCHGTRPRSRQVGLQ